MSDDLDELRRDLVRERGLPATAAHLVNGSTVEEIETQADALAALVDAHQEREPEQGDPLTAALAEGAHGKAARRRELARSLHGPGRQERDELGRYSKPAAGFDGGARKPAPPEPESHNEWLTRRLIEAQAHRGSGGW